MAAFADPYDILIIGGGINGAGIARDAAGRGLSVLLVEQDDLAGHTSSASTKLIHGGLRYLEYGEFRLVRESLIERERLLDIAPHIIWPLRFVLPQTRSPRPGWMVRLGLFLYDHLGGRKRLPATETITLARSHLGQGLRDQLGKAFVYSDCWVEDSRLVVLNAIDAAERGATIQLGARFLAAQRQNGEWVATLDTADGQLRVRAKALVNAAGPWVAEVLGKIGQVHAGRDVRLVKGSHIVVPPLYEGAHAFMLQNPDRRIVFAIPYEGRFTLLGTTDEPWEGAPGRAAISVDETRYLLDTANRYFERRVEERDIVWTYSGIRPLYDDKAGNASAVTRDYLLDLEDVDGAAPVLSIFGGKITTYRKLAEHAMEKLSAYFPTLPGAWTADVALPGGDIEADDFERFLAEQIAARPGLPAPLLRRLARAYGTRMDRLLHGAQGIGDLGKDFGGGLTEAEVGYLVDHEMARTAEDIFYRRSKLALHTAAEAQSRVQAYLDERVRRTKQGPS